jgi:hypothetical protein
MFTGESPKVLKVTFDSAIVSTWNRFGRDLIIHHMEHAAFGDLSDTLLGYMVRRFLLG